MSATKHTPGPWFYTRSAMDTRWIIDCDPGKAIAATGGYEPNNEANARLIAAAPELLEALKGAIGALEFSRDFHRDLGNEDQALVQNKLDAAIQAIAKAEGRS